MIKIILAINRRTKIQQNNGISSILAGMKITPDLSTLSNNVRSRSIGSAIYSRNDTIPLIQTNSMDKIDNITRIINNRTNSLLTNTIQQPIEFIHSNHEIMISNQSKLSNQTDQVISLPVTSQSKSLAATIHRFHNNSNRRQIFNLNCKDLQNSCKLWLRNHPKICMEQYQSMKIQCKRTCEYCAHLDN